MYYKVNINRYNPKDGFTCKRDYVIFDCKEQLNNFINHKYAYNYLDDSLVLCKDLLPILF